MTRTDPDTGLPELPDNLFWRFSAVDAHGDTDREDMWGEIDPHYQPSSRKFTWRIMEKETREVKHLREAYTETERVERNWWGRPKTITELRPYDEHYTLPVERELTLFRYPLFEAVTIYSSEEFIMYRKDPEWETSSDWWYGAVARAYRFTDLTPEYVHQCAFDAYKQYIDLKHEEALQINKNRNLRLVSANYLGDYPPKKLGGAA